LIIEITDCDLGLEYFKFRKQPLAAGDGFIACTESVSFKIVVRAWDKEVCFLCGLRFKPCGCLYDGHWRLTWSLTSEPVGLVEVRASWPGHPH
jgi:hypothetical protein